MQGDDVEDFEAEAPGERQALDNVETVEFGSTCRHLGEVPTWRWRSAANPSPGIQRASALEHAAGLRLLVRPGGRRPVTPTDAGERLLRHARRASAAMRAADPRAIVCIVSDHGFAATTKETHVNAALVEAGLIRLTPPRRRGSGP